MFPLEPASIALIGASNEKGKLGNAILNNLLTQGYRGNVFPVNPKHAEILNIKTYPSISDIRESVDMAVIVTPAGTVSKLARECAERKVKTLVVISAGFGEMHAQEGKDREQELVQICQAADMALIGPNCLGVMRPSAGLNASFALSLPPRGNIALLSQSGALAVGILDQAETLSLGFSSIISMGNKALQDEADFLEWCEEDEETKVIGMYLESIKNASRLREVAERVGAKKRIVLIKSGVSEHGKKAVSSHTGALAGATGLTEALCSQTGMTLAHSMREFLDAVRVLSAQPPLLSPNIAIITNAGGPGVLATDAAERERLVLADMSKKQKDDLTNVLPPMASIANPIDVLGDALEDRYEAALSACGKDKNIDGVTVLLTPQIMTPVDAVAEKIAAFKKKNAMMPVTVGFIGEQSVHRAESTLQSYGIPTFDTPEEAVHGLALLRSKKTERTTAEKEDPKGDDRASGAAGILAKREGLLDEETLEELFGLYGIPLPEGRIAFSSGEAAQIAHEVGFPVIAKVSSPDILHKTDIGGVRLDLHDEKSVEDAFKEILSNAAKHMPTAAVRGVLIQEMLPPGHEFIIGGVREEHADPLILVGLGGIYTELMRDTAFRLAPLSKQDAYTMLQELKSWKLLLGLRGESQLDIDALAALIVQVGTMLTECPRIKELDINPALVRTKGVAVADAKVILRPKEKRFITP